MVLQEAQGMEYFRKSRNSEVARVLEYTKTECLDYSTEFVEYAERERSEAFQFGDYFKV